MGDFQGIWDIINNFLSIRLELYGFSFTWGGVLITSLFGSLLVYLLMYLFHRD